MHPLGGLPQWASQLPGGGWPPLQPPLCHAPSPALWWALAWQLLALLLVPVGLASTCLVALPPWLACQTGSLPWRLRLLSCGASWLPAGLSLPRCGQVALPPPSWRLPQWPLRAWSTTLPPLATPLLSSPCWLPMPRWLRWCAHSLGFLLLPRAMPHPVPPVLVLDVHHASAWLPRSAGPLLVTLLPPL